MKTEIFIPAILLVVNAIFWGIPAAMYCYLVYSQFADGNALAWWLLAIGPGSYCVGLFLGVILPAILLWLEKDAQAMTLAIVLLPIGVLWGLWGILMLGST